MGKATPRSGLSSPGLTANRVYPICVFQDATRREPSCYAIQYSRHRLEMTALTTQACVYWITRTSRISANLRREGDGLQPASSFGLSQFSPVFADQIDDLPCIERRPDGRSYGVSEKACLSPDRMSAIFGRFSVRRLRGKNRPWLPRYPRSAGRAANELRSRPWQALDPWQASDPYAGSTSNA